jgi:hypothetical protein
MIGYPKIIFIFFGIGENILCSRSGGFIFSYNDPENIDRILLDRIHRIRFDNLTLDDKMVIVRDYILPEINRKMGFCDTVVLTDEMIELLRKAGEPSPEDLKEERAHYQQDAKNDPFMPEWEDFFVYGYPLHKIFKHTPIKGTEVETATAVKKKVVEEDIEPDLGYKVSPPKTKAPVVEDDDDEPVVAKTAKKSAPKPVEVEDDDEDTMPWMSED